MKCPVCNAELPSTAKFCGSCGTTLSASAPPPSPETFYQQASPAFHAVPGYGGGTLPAVRKKYKVLRFIAVLIKVLAFVGGGVLVIAGVVLLVAGAASSSPTTTFGTDTGPAALFGGILGSVIMMIYGVFVFIFLYAYSEWMYVFMDIEENTRITNEMLSGRR